MFEKMKKNKKSPIELKAKSSALEKILGDAEGEMGGKLDKMKKVTVAAPDKSGLEKGLDKAKEILGHSANPALSGAESADEEESEVGEEGSDSEEAHEMEEHYE